MTVSRRLFAKRAVFAFLALLFTTSALLRPAFGASLNKDEIAQDLLQRHNRNRAEANAKSLRIDSKLTTAAQKYAEHLAKVNKFSHFADSTLGTRLKRAGAKYSVAGENLAKGQGTAAGAVQSWMKSSGHRANILNKRFRKAGFGVARDKKGAIIWVAVFTN